MERIELSAESLHLEEKLALEPVRFITRYGKTEPSELPPELQLQIYKVKRLPRQTYYVDVGDLVKEQAQETMETVLAGFKGRVVEDEPQIHCPYIPKLPATDFWKLHDVVNESLSATTKLEMLGIDKSFITSDIETDVFASFEKTLKDLQEELPEDETSFAGLEYDVWWTPASYKNQFYQEYEVKEKSWYYDSNRQQGTIFPMSLINTNQS